MQHSDQKKFRADVIKNAAGLFCLNEKETEELANKAGLTMMKTGETGMSLTRLLNSYEGSIKNLLIRSNVTERMLEYIRKGRIPTKETIIGIAIALGLNEAELRELLACYGFVLSKSMPNDMVILFELKNNTGDGLVSRINNILDELGLPILGTRFY